MKHLNLRGFPMALLLMMVGIFMLKGCDSGEKAVDKVTGNQDVKQYHKLKKDIEKIADQQAKRYNEISDENNREGEEKR
ncbi:MAG: hypothetical protein H8E19_10825 [Deltaproteobacteria bacterium]|uniref:Uncharacterized protein n=1 Tax=Candidatus Desulfacyla euxinica TaxID=2841693 RepID=A0A8J6N1A6_9DELT|nr:hypothetical protein [Candidatus Desulfacyla euxinica]MBL7216724.1 hypothetical protein [Desulfobacteraceae bacterium]